MIEAMALDTEANDIIGTRWVARYPLMINPKITLNRTHLGRRVARNFPAQCINFGKTS